MSKEQTRPTRRFAVAVDDTQYSVAALEHAIKYTRRSDVLRLIHAIHMTYTLDEQTGEKIFYMNKEVAEPMFDKYKKICEQNNKKCEFIAVPYFGKSTEISNAVCRDAQESRVEGIFVGSRPTNVFNRFLIGEVGEQIIQNCPLASTTIVRINDPGHY